jgi:hypothetical protein
MATFSRGDVLLTQFPFTDLTGTAVRPCLVVSPGLIGQDLIVAGISSGPSTLNLLVLTLALTA